MKIGASPRVRRFLPQLPDVTQDPHGSYDVTLIFPEEDGPWLDRCFRRVRPQFVETAEEAIAWYKFYSGSE